MRDRFAMVPFLLAMLSLAPGSRCEEKKWDWLKATPVPCEGVGVHGAYRSFAVAQVDLAPDGSKEITSLKVYINSAAVALGPTTISAFVTVRPSNGPEKKVALIRPANAALEAPQGANDSKSLYLPEGTKLSIPKGATFEITVSAVVQLSGGGCSLGDSKKTISLF